MIDTCPVSSLAWRGSLLEKIRERRNANDTSQGAKAPHRRIGIVTERNSERVPHPPFEPSLLTDGGGNCRHRPTTQRDSWAVSRPCLHEAPTFTLRRAGPPSLLPAPNQRQYPPRCSMTALSTGVCLLPLHHPHRGTGWNRFGEHTSVSVAPIAAITTPTALSDLNAP